MDVAEIGRAAGSAFEILMPGTEIRMRGEFGIVLVTGRREAMTPQQDLGCEISQLGGAPPRSRSSQCP